MSDDNSNKQPECDECGSTKNAYNQEKEEWRCNKRSCPESPMNEELTYIGGN